MIDRLVTVGCFRSLGSCIQDLMSLVFNYSRLYKAEQRSQSFLGSALSTCRECECWLSLVNEKYTFTHTCCAYMLAILRNCDRYECIRARGSRVSQREKWLGEQEWRLTKRKKKIKDRDRRTVRPLNGEKNLRNAGVSQSFCVRRVLASIHFRGVDESSSSPSFSLLFNEKQAHLLRYMKLFY